MHGALLAIALDRHTAGDSDAVAEIERAVGRGPIAHAVDEVDHVRFGIGTRHARHFRAVGAILLFGQVLESLRRATNGPIRAEHVLGDAEALVAEARIPR